MKRLFKAIGRYFRDSFEELKKVTWPTRNRAIRLTFIVLGFCLVSALVLGALDLAFNRGYQLLVSYALRVSPPAESQQVTPSPEPAPLNPQVDVNASGPVQVEPVPAAPTPSN